MYSASTSGISKTRETIIISTLCLMIFVMFLSNDMHAPNIKEIELDLNTTESGVRMLFIISNFFAYFMQLVWGSFADCLKRKRFITICAILAITGKFLSVFAQNFIQMMIARTIEYSSIGGIWAIVSSICSDICKNDSKRIAKVFSVIDILYPLSIMIGPFIGEKLGTFLDKKFGGVQGFEYLAGWRGCFALMLVLSSLTFLVALVAIKETLEETKPFDVKGAVYNCIALLKDKTFSTCTIIYTACASAILILQTSSPHCYMKYFNIQKDVFTWLYNLPVLFGVIFTGIYIVLIKKTTFKTIMKIGVSICLLFILCGALYTAGCISRTPAIFAIVTSIIFCVERFVVPSIDAIFVSFRQDITLAQKYALMHACSVAISSIFGGQCSKYYKCSTEKDLYLVFWMVAMAIIFMIVYVFMWKKYVKCNFMQ